MKRHCNSRTSPWDVKENLPLDYARIYQFKNFDRMKRRIIKEAVDIEGALVKLLNLNPILKCIFIVLPIALAWLVHHCTYMQCTRTALEYLVVYPINATFNRIWFAGT